MPDDAPQNQPGLPLAALDTSTVFITVRGRNGEARAYALPPEVKSPPSYVTLRGVAYGLDGSWEVPAESGGRITAQYAPVAPCRALDITTLPFATISTRAASQEEQTT
jgi:hypothetical protein